MKVRHHDWLGGLILVLAVILVYQPVWYAGYLWDDDVLVTANPRMAGLHGLLRIWTTSAADICPLTLTTFWVEHFLWGKEALPYHLVNVLMQGGCAVLLWRVLRNLQIPGAWLGAALWALHPVQVESVAWISEMKNTQSCLFFLLSILFFLRWLKEENNQKGSDWNSILTLLFAVMAMAGKSSTVVLPVVMCLCAWWVEGRWRWRNLEKLAPIFLFSLFACAVSLWTQKFQMAIAAVPQWARSWPERLVTAGDAIWFYLGKLLWPHPLITIYPRWKIEAGEWVSYLPLAAAIILLLLLWWKRQSWARPYFFAWAYFLVALLPVLGFANMGFFRHSFVADHFQYLAAMGPMALAGAGMVRLADFLIPEKLRLQQILGAAVLLILGIVSWQRVWAYTDEETLWTDTLAWNPNSWVAHHNLGDVLVAKKQIDRAFVEYRKALEINPDYPETYYNLGNLFVKTNQVDQAIVEYQKVLELNPDYLEARVNLGNAFFQLGRTDEAIEQYRRAIKINPAMGILHYDLGLALAQKGQLDEAVAQYQTALGINPNDVKTRYDLGNTLLQKGELDEAVAQFQKALELNPNVAQIHNNLGCALSQKGRTDEAMAQFQKALELNPNFAEAYDNLGKTLFQKGRIDEAIAQYQKALELNPSYSDAQNNLTAAQAAAHQGAGPP